MTSSSNHITQHSEGYAFNCDCCISGLEICKIFDRVTDFKEFCDKNREIIGMYCVCIPVKDEIFLYVSPGGFHKLFYSSNDKGFRISTKAEELSNGDINYDAVNIFRYALHCWGENTIYQNVYASEPGFAISLSLTAIKKEKLFSYDLLESELFTSPYNNLLDQGKSVFNSVIERMILYLNKKQAVIPLSGGYDSRFILTALVSKGYPNILTFTYGTTNTREKENAQKTANRLGVKWIFIPYTESTADIALKQINIDSYLDFMVNGNSFPSLHEIIALTYLKNNNLLYPDAVFIPGHSGDLLGGSQFLKAFPYNLKFNKIQKFLIKEKLSFYPHNKKFKKEISAYINQYISQDYNKNMLPPSVFEDIDLREKISKIILNASKAYVYFGYYTYFPFWDKELIEFFKHVPVSYKLEKKLYNHILQQLLFNPFNVSYSRELHPTIASIVLQNFKNRLKPFLPLSVKHKLRIKNDNILYHYFTQNWYKQMIDSNFIPHNYDFNYNSIIAQWIIYNLKSKSKTR